MIRIVESKQKDIRRWSMTIYIDSTSINVKSATWIFECKPHVQLMLPMVMTIAM
jgi:hypothetical protein